MKLDPGFGGLQFSGPPQYSHGIGRTVQRKIGLSQAVQVGGIGGAQFGGALQVATAASGFPC